MLRVFLMFAAVGCWVPAVQAETIELTNGKMLNGQIVSMDANQVKFKPADEGSQEQTLQRTEIAQITFGKRAEAIMMRKNFSVANLLRELREEGLDEQAWQDVQKRIKAIGVPELRRYLDDTVAGLQQDLEQVRRDAEDAQEEINALREQYGPQVDTLNDYLTALQQIMGVTDDVEGAEVRVSVDVDEKEPTTTPNQANSPNQSTSPDRTKAATNPSTTSPNRPQAPPVVNPNRTTNPDGKTTENGGRENGGGK